MMAGGDERDYPERDRDQRRQRDYRDYQRGDKVSEDYYSDNEEDYYNSHRRNFRRDREWYDREQYYDRDSYYDRDRESWHDRDPNWYDRDAWYEHDDRSDSRRERRGAREDRGSKDRSRSRSRERDRSHFRERDRDYDSYDQYHDYDRDYDRSFNRRQEEPNQTLMIRSLPQWVIEDDIIGKLKETGFTAKDIRLMRRKETGESRGFAFVEFANLPEAIKWKSIVKDQVQFGNEPISPVHFSIPKEMMNNRDIQKNDWTCLKCGVNNFKRRDQCFKCGTSKEEGGILEPTEDISLAPTNCLLLRNLGPTISEARILSELGTLTSMPIKSIRNLKDPLNGAPRCICSVELHTTGEATQLFSLLQSMNPPFSIDGSIVIVNYGKKNLPSTQSNLVAVNAASVALAAAQWTNNTDPTTVNTSTAISTSMVGSNGSQGHAVPTPSSLGTVVVNGVTYQKYPIPDTSSYQYEEKSGYYYDPSTGFYYDAKSHYYYNPQTQKYIYWSSEHQTYLPAPDSSETSSAASTSTSASSISASPVSATKEQAPTQLTPKEASDSGKEKPKDKQIDKVKTAKKIAKEMEQWAKTLNQKKEAAKSGAVATPQVISTPSSSSFGTTVSTSFTPSAFASISSTSIPSRNESFSSTPVSVHKPSPLLASVTTIVKTETIKERAEEFQNSHLVSDMNTIDDIEEFIKAEENRLLDTEKFICLLCKRQLGSLEQLRKHQQMSELHKTNLAVLKKSKLTEDQYEQLEKHEGRYRDRAKERRQKYGMPEKPESTFDRGYPDSRSSKGGSLESGVDFERVERIPSSNIGSKMMKAMGWNEGEGLGRSRHGRTDIIEVEQRAGGLGLGAKSGGGLLPGETYKDAVKRAAMERFREMQERH